MKKIYEVPSIEVVTIQAQQMIAASIQPESVRNTHMESDANPYSPLPVPVGETTAEESGLGNGQAGWVNDGVGSTRSKSWAWDDEY